MVYECQFFELPDYVIQFHRIGFEKLAPSRNIIKNVLNHKITAFGAYFRLLFHTFRAVYLYHSAQLFATKTCAQFHLCNCSNRSQCLASKTHSMQVEEVFCFANFGCTMSLKGKSSIGVTHSHAIIYHLNECPTGLLEYDLYLGSSGIHCVFHKFLYHRGGSLYYLSCSYLICHRIG